MEISRKCCRLCLTETEFNVSLFGTYSRKNNIIDKILVCLKIVIEERDNLNTICYKCANNVEKYYNFIAYVKKSQTKFDESNSDYGRKRWDFEGSPTSHVKRHVTSYVREQVIDADYTFSFLEVPEEKKEAKSSSPFFSYFSPPNAMLSKEPIWKAPRPIREEKTLEKQGESYKKQRKTQHNSRDLFESQSQENDDVEQKSLDWKLTPDDSILKRVRQKCFGQTDF